MTRLKEIREAKGVKQTAIAQHLGISRQTYSSYERNPEMMSVSQAKAVCEFLGCEINDIFLSSNVCLTNN